MILLRLLLADLFDLIGHRCGDWECTEDHGFFANRADRLRDKADDAYLVALVRERLANDTGERVDLDDFARHLGFDPEVLAAEARAEHALIQDSQQERDTQ